MEKRKKAVAVIAALFFIILSTNIVLAEMPNPTDKFYVNDYAEVLSDAQEEELCADGEQLYEETTAQVVVLTVDSTDGKEISDYANEVGEGWGIGNTEDNNGVLIVLSVTDRNVWVAVGHGLADRLTNDIVEQLLNQYALPYYKNDEFTEGTIQLYYALINEVREEYGLERTEIPETSNELEENGRPVTAAISKNTEDDLEITLGEVFLGIFLLLLVFVAAVFFVTCVPLFILVNIFLLFRWWIYIIIDKITGKSLSKGYKERNFCWPAMKERIQKCLFWYILVLDWLEGKSEDDSDSSDESSGGSFDGDGAGRSF